MRSRSANVNLIADTGAVTGYDEEARVFQVSLDAYGTVTARWGRQGEPFDPASKPRVLCVRLPRAEWLILTEIPGTVVEPPPPIEEEVFGERRTDPIEGRLYPIGRTTGYRGLADEKTLLGRVIRAGDKLTLGVFGGLLGLFRSGTAIVKANFGCFSLWTKAKEWITRCRTASVEGLGFGVLTEVDKDGATRVSAVVQGALSSPVPDVRVVAGSVPADSRVRLKRGVNRATPTVRGLQIRLGPDFIAEYDRDLGELRISSPTEAGRQQVTVRSDGVGVHRDATSFDVSSDGILIKAPRIVVAGPVVFVPATAAVTADTVADVPVTDVTPTLALSPQGDTVDFSSGVRMRNRTTNVVEGAVLASHLKDLATAVQAIAQHLHETEGSPSASLGSALTQISSALAQLSNTSGSSTGA